MPFVRPSRPEDVDALTRIYAHYVSGSTCTFETDPPPAAEMARRRDDVLSQGHPWLVAELDGVVCGYAYASQYRARAAFRYTVENSIYLAPEATGRGVGRALLAELLRACEAHGSRRMVAVIGDQANQASIALHQSMGFKHVGVIPSSGWKFERWIDLILMERALGVGDTQPPQA